MTSLSVNNWYVKLQKILPSKVWKTKLSSREQSEKYDTSNYVRLFFVFLYLPPPRAPRFSLKQSENIASAKREWLVTSAKHEEPREGEGTRLSSFHLPFLPCAPMSMQERGAWVRGSFSIIRPTDSQRPRLAETAIRADRDSRWPRFALTAIRKDRNSPWPRFEKTAIRADQDGRRPRFALTTIRGDRDSRWPRLALTAKRGDRDWRRPRFALTAMRWDRDLRWPRYV